MRIAVSCPNRHPRHLVTKPPPYDRQRQQSKGCCSRSDRKSDRCALVSLSRDAGQLVQRRPLPEDRSPIIRQAIARVLIEVFLGGRLGSAIDWRWVSFGKGCRLVEGVAMVSGGMAFVWAVESDRTRGEVIGGFNLRQKELFC
jgi:hypothetical protein